MTGTQPTAIAELPNGATVLVAVQGHSGPSDVAASQAFSLDPVRDALEGVAELAHNAFTKARPDNVKVEFGLDMKVEAGKLAGLIVSGSGGASLKVTLEWKSEADS